MAEVIRQARGADFSARITLKNGDGSPTNLTGGTVTSEIVHAGGVIPLVVAPVDAAAGIYALTLDEPGTAQIPLGALSVWRATWVTAGGETRKADFARIEGV
jgi:sugar (pentulose or hexulose) kinase